MLCLFLIQITECLLLVDTPQPPVSINQKIFSLGIKVTEQPVRHMFPQDLFFQGIRENALAVPLPLEQVDGVLIHVHPGLKRTVHHLPVCTPSHKGGNGALRFHQILNPKGCLRYQCTHGLFCTDGRDRLLHEPHLTLGILVLIHGLGASDHNTSLIFKLHAVSFKTVAGLRVRIFPLGKPNHCLDGIKHLMPSVGGVKMTQVLLCHGSRSDTCQYFLLLCLSVIPDNLPFGSCHTCTFHTLYARFPFHFPYN